AGRSRPPRRANGRARTPRPARRAGVARTRARRRRAGGPSARSRLAPQPHGLESGARENAFRRARRARASEAQGTRGTPAGPLLHSRAMSGTVGLEKDGAIGWIVFDHPERRNAVSAQMWRQIPGVLEAFAKDADVRVIVMRGAGDLAFVSGADISE